MAKSKPKTKTFEKPEEVVVPKLDELTLVTKWADDKIGKNQSVKIHMVDPIRNFFRVNFFEKVKGEVISHNKLISSYFVTIVDGHVVDNTKGKK